MSESGPTENDVEGFREKYPNLRFELKKAEDLKARYVEISGLDKEEDRKKTVLAFSNSEVLGDVLDTTYGFLNLRFLDPELGVRVADSVCILVDGLENHPSEWFACDYLEQQFDTFMGFLSQTKKLSQDMALESTWIFPYFGNALRSELGLRLVGSVITDYLLQGVSKTKRSAPVEMKEEELKARELASAVATLLASRVRTQEDLVRALVSTLWGSARSGYIVIRCQSMNRDILDRSWRELVDWAHLKYYSIHGVMPSTMREWPAFLTIDRAAPSLTDAIAASDKPRKEHYSPVEHEPLGYIRVAEASTLPAFTYLSLYHVLEYFFDEVAHADLQSEIMKVLRSPKLESNRERYARAIADLVERFRSPIHEDSEKLKLTLKRFIPFATLEDDTPAGVLETLRKSVKFEGGLKLDGVNLDDEDRFFGNLAARVYAMRNAIVHSKHAESEVKGSYDPGGKDAGRLEKESEMLKHFVLEVMFRSGSLS